MKNSTSTFHLLQTVIPDYLVSIYICITPLPLFESVPEWITPAHEPHRKKASPLKSNLLIDVIYWRDKLIYGMALWSNIHMWRCPGTRCALMDVAASKDQYFEHIMWYLHPSRVYCVRQYNRAIPLCRPATD